MISAIIPTQGTLGPDGEPFLGWALAAAALADEIVVVTTDDKLTAEAWEAISSTGVLQLDVPGPFNFSVAVNAGRSSLPQATPPAAERRHRPRAGHALAVD